MSALRYCIVLVNGIALGFVGSTLLYKPMLDKSVAREESTYSQCSSTLEKAKAAVQGCVKEIAECALELQHCGAPTERSL